MWRRIAANVCAANAREFWPPVWIGLIIMCIPTHFGNSATWCRWGNPDTVSKIFVGNSISPIWGILLRRHEAGYYEWEITIHEFPVTLGLPTTNIRYQKPGCMFSYLLWNWPLSLEAVSFVVRDGFCLRLWFCWEVVKNLRNIILMNI